MHGAANMSTKTLMMLVAGVFAVNIGAFYVYSTWDRSCLSLPSTIMEPACALQVKGQPLVSMSERKSTRSHGESVSTSIACPNRCQADANAVCRHDRCICSPGLTGVDCSFVELPVELADPLKVQQLVNQHLNSAVYHGIGGALFHVRMVNDMIRQRVPGDVVECGVFKGGSAAVIANALQASTRKKLWLFDSWNGHPDVNHEANFERASSYKIGEVGGSMLASIHDVRNTLSLIAPEYDQKRVKFRQGFFNETFKQELPEAVAYLHIDADWYEIIQDVWTCSTIVSCGAV